MENKLAIAVRRARASDAPALADLINRAYAIEAFFVDGDRTNAGEVEVLLESGMFLVLESAADAAGMPSALAAAVYLDLRDPSAAYIGMLSVDPELQGIGLGRRLVGIAEAMAEAMGAPAVRLRIINLREELWRWYRGLGYSEVGTAPYEHRPVKQPCHFVEMYKPLARSLGAAA